MEALRDTAIRAAIEAGKAILEIYHSGDFDVTVKGDDSPLTRADIASHEVIVRHLDPLGIPVLSEEGRDMPYEERSGWSELWIVDPIDGTKEFIKRNGEFTVNIALARDGVPVLGVIYVPVTGELYVGVEGEGACKAPMSSGRMVGSPARAAVRRSPRRDGGAITRGRVGRGPRPRGSVGRGPRARPPVLRQPPRLGWGPRVLGAVVAPDEVEPSEAHVVGRDGGDVDAQVALEREVLGGFAYQPNEVVLHTDTSIMPRRRRAWASWNYHLTEPASELPTVTYWMNLLQGLEAQEEYLVTLNRSADIDPARVVASFVYDHPVYSMASVRSQERHAEIDGVNGVHFCGAYWRYGFHEDGLQSGLTAARRVEERAGMEAALA